MGTTHIDALEAFEADPDTKAIVMIGEIGGDREERAFQPGPRDQAGRRLRRQVRTPESKTMEPRQRHHLRLLGHRAGQKEALEAVNVKVGKTPSEPPTHAGSPAEPLSRHARRGRGDPGALAVQVIAVAGRVISAGGAGLPSRVTSTRPAVAAPPTAQRWWRCGCCPCTACC